MEQAWGHGGICFHHLLNVTNQKARLHFPIDPAENDINLQLFEGLFPKDYLHVVILVETKKELKDPLLYGELIQWIGIWVLVSTLDGSDQCSFWLSKEVDMYEGVPFCLSSVMTRNWFETILSAMMYTSNEPPVYVDRFWEVRQSIDAWNVNMAHNVSPSWINAIDKSMSKWVSEYTCPGFMYVPRKPRQFGNEYHDAGCADSDIIWQVDLREGKD